ncbi:hypothetical protein JL722_10847 [Aureococcus anophagefferens]|nr:hypothetical protein JL722_10847 [Aureococcus anophagefferens]
MTRRRLVEDDFDGAERTKAGCGRRRRGCLLADLDGAFEPDEPTALVEAKKQKGRPLGSVSGPTSRPTHFLKACVDAKAGKAWLMELPYKYRQIGNNKTRAVLRYLAHQTSEVDRASLASSARARMTPTPGPRQGRLQRQIASKNTGAVLIDMITLTDGEGGVYEACLFSSSTMLNIGKKAAAVYGEDNILCVTDGKHKTEAAGWIIIPFGTSTRYFDRDKGKYSNKFLPIAYIFTKSETKGVFTFARGTVKALSVFMGVKVTFSALCADASPAIRSGFLGFEPPLDPGIADVADVADKGVDDLDDDGITTARGEDENVAPQSPNVRDRSSHVLKGPPPRPRKVRGDDDDEEQESEDECPVDEEAAREIGEALVKRARYTITMPQERMRERRGSAGAASAVQYIQEDVDWRHYDKFEELFEGFLSEFNLERTKERRAWVKGIACAHLKRGQEAEKGDGVVADKRDAAGSPSGEPQVAVRHVAGVADVDTASTPTRGVPQDLVRDGADARGAAMASPPTRDIVPTAHDGEAPRRSRGPEPAISATFAGHCVDWKLECQKPCPKQAGSKSAQRYEGYMHATTVGEYKAFGGSAADLRHDIRKEFVKVILPAGVAAPARAAVVEDRAAVADLVLLNDEALAPASRSASTDYYHVLRKITQEVGIKLRDAKAHGGELKRVVVLLHSCETLEQFARFAKARRCARDDLILADYLTKPSTGYFVEPFNRWFVAANWLRQPDGTVKGARYGPSTQHGERYNKMLEDDILGGKRASKEHLLETIIPKLLKLDGARLGPFELMDVPTAIPSDVLAAARRVVKLQEYFVLAPKGAVTNRQRNCVKRIYVNRPKFHGRGDPACASEIGRHGRYTKALLPRALQ